MMDITERILNTVLFGILWTWLLAQSIPQICERPKAYWKYAVSAGLFSLLQWLNIWQDYGYYLYVLCMYAGACCILRLWTKLHWTAVCQRCIPLLLMVECVMVTVSHASQKLVGFDVLRTLPFWSMLLSCLFLAGILTLFEHGILRLYPRQVHANKVTLALTLLSSIPFLFVRQITLWLPVGVTDVSFAIVATLLFCTALSVILTVSLERLIDSTEREERASLTQKVEIERMQQAFLQRKESIERVRAQYHDMKNLLIYLDQSSDKQEMHEQVTRIMGSIQPFELAVETGNDVIDILLSEKLDVCKQEDIACHIMVDGRSLSFMDPMDLVILFGNAMDNAIEACKSIEKSATRSIQVRTASQPGFVVVHIHNTCLPSVSVHGGMPKTTKHDANLHGYGLKNMLSIAEKWGGVMQCQAEHGEFELTFLLPTEQTEA